jgi:hypothetical protein
MGTGDLDVRSHEALLSRRADFDTHTSDGPYRGVSLNLTGALGEWEKFLSPSLKSPVSHPLQILDLLAEHN